MKTKLTSGAVLVLIAAAFNANAGPDGVFLCDSQAPTTSLLPTSATTGSLVSAATANHLATLTLVP